MLTAISDFTQQLITSKRTSSNGWISFNAVCRHHHGERPDSKQRGGLHPNPDGSINYHCFNCGFKASYQPGRHLSYKFRKLLYWLGATDKDVKRLNIEALRVKELIGFKETDLETVKKEITFETRSLPSDAKTFDQLAVTNLNEDDQLHLLNAIDYVASDRGIDISPRSRGRYTFYLSKDRRLNMHRRVIIPCYWSGRLIGYTARALPNYGDIRPKYINQYDNNYVFNVDKQLYQNKFVLVCEGPFEAMSLDGVALMGKEITEPKADIIESLGKEIIVVPQADRASLKMIDAAVEFGWSVSFPVWLETCKDADEAVRRYGKLFVVSSILNAVEHNKIKISVKKKEMIR